MFYKSDNLAPNPTNTPNINLWGGKKVKPLPCSTGQRGGAWSSDAYCVLKDGSTQHLSLEPLPFSSLNLVLGAQTPREQCLEWFPRQGISAEVSDIINLRLAACCEAMWFEWKQLHRPAVGGTVKKGLGSVLLEQALRLQKPSAIPSVFSDPCLVWALSSFGSLHQWHRTD